MIETKAITVTAAPQSLHDLGVHESAEVQLRNWGAETFYVGSATTATVADGWPVMAGEAYHVLGGNLETYLVAAAPVEVRTTSI